MARAYTVGSQLNGIISYGHNFTDDEFPINQKLASNLMYTYSSGRWSTRRFRKTHFFSRKNSTEPPAWGSSTWGSRDYLVCSETDPAQLNIPIQITSGSYTGFKVPQGFTSYSSWSAEEWFAAATQAGNRNGMGMNLLVKGEMNQYFRPVTDWNYNKIAMYPKICGVYADIFDKNTGDYPYGVTYNVPTIGHPVDLYDFYYNNTRPAHNNRFLGYTLTYDILVQGASESSSWQYLYFADEFLLSCNKYEFYNFANVKKLTLDGFYAFTGMGRTLLGIETPTSTIAGTYIANWIGPDSIEGIPVCDTVSALLYWSGNDKMAGDLPVIPAGTLESELLNYLDCVKIALQCGLPVITEGATKAAFLGGTDIAECSEDYVFFPKIADSRVSTEEYLKGQAAIKDSKQYKDAQDGKGVMSETPEFDRDDTDTNQYTDDIPLNQPPFTTIDKFSRYYALSSTDLKDFCDFIYTDDTSVIARIIDGLKLNGENPMNFMLGLRMLPFNLMSYIHSEQEEIGFGNGVYTGVQAEKITKDSFIVDLGTCKFNRYHKNFLDYEPYTTAKLYIPYCGEISVPTSVFVGHEINVKLIVDVTTGSCIGVVYKDKIPAMYANGVIGVEIPIIGTNATEYVNTAIDLAGKFASGAAQAGTNLAMMGTTTFSASSGAIGNFSATASTSTTSSSKVNIPNALGGVGQMLEAAYEFNNMPTPLEVSGTGMAFSGFYKPQYCYFVIQQSVPMNVQGYAENIGYACLESGTISDYVDCFIVANNPKVQPSTATYSETSELNELLSTGVWV